MPGLIHATTTRDVRRVLTAGLVAALSISLWRTVFAGHLGEPTLAEIAVSAALAFAVVVVFAWLGGERGFLLLWILVLAAWLMNLHRALTEADWLPRAVATLIPDRFVAWNAAALPAGLAAMFFLRSWRSPCRRSIVAGAAVWLGLLAANSALAQYAPDVGSTPRTEPVLAWPVGVLGFVAPFVLSALFILRLRASHGHGHATPSGK